MQITVRLIGVFRLERFKEQICEYPADTKVEEIVQQLQIPDRALGTVLINGVHAAKNALLEDDDTLVLLPILGGG